MKKYKVLVSLKIKVYIDVEAVSREEALEEAYEKPIADLLKAEIHDVGDVDAILAYEAD